MMTVGKVFIDLEELSQKRTFAVDSRDSGLVYLHTVGLASHIRNGNFGAVCAGRHLPRAMMPKYLKDKTQI